MGNEKDATKAATEAEAEAEAAEEVSKSGTSEKTGSNAAGSSAAVRGASLLILLQVASRAATFIANQLLLRFLTAQLLGIATQLEVYYLSVLFFARESLRVAIQRQGGRNDGGKKASQSAVNLAYVSIVLGVLVALVFGWLYLASVRGGDIADTPFLTTALGLYAAASIVELLSEPAFVVLQLRLQFKARAAAESVGTVLRCGITLGTAVVATRRGLDIGVLPFALGQLAYGLGLLAVYLWHGTGLAKRDGFALFPRRLQSEEAQKDSSDDYTLLLFDRSTLHLASSMAAQSVVKHILTQGDTFLVSILSTPTAQGVYALANNYGGLAARLLFQPIEESSRNYFSRLLSNEDEKKENKKKQESDDKEKENTSKSPVAQASQDLLTLLKAYVLLSLIITSLGPAAAGPFLALVTGPRWAHSGAAETLAAYMWYIPLLAINGVAEAFVASVATEAEVHRQSAWMGIFSLVFAAAGYVCLQVLQGGAIGLVVANGINMACRIVWCTAFVKRYFGQRNISFALSDLMPHPFAVLAAVVTSQALQRLVGRKNDPSLGGVAQITQLVQVAALGLPFLLVL